MKKNILMVKPHSIIDVITNSSSELFICDTSKTEETIIELLQEMLTLYNKLFDSDRTYDDCFGVVYTIHEENFDMFFEDVVLGWHYIPWELKIPKFNFDYNWNDEVEKQEVGAYKEKYYEDIKKGMIGYTCIYSSDDNSIPYELFELIESAFNGDRIHLG